MPFTRLLTGRPSVTEERAKRDDRWMAKKQEMDRLLKSDFVRALTDPDLPERLKQRTFKTFLTRPDLLQSFNAEDLSGAILSKTALPIERKIAEMSPLEALKLQTRIAEQLRDAPSLSAAERRYLTRVWRASLVRAGSAK